MSIYVPQRYTAIGPTSLRAQVGTAASFVQDRVPALANLVWGLQQEIGHSKAHVNLYCSWPGQQGFECHYDTHEVLSLFCHSPKSTSNKKPSYPSGKSD